MDRNDVCRYLEAQDGDFGKFCLGLSLSTPEQIERVAWLALWIRDPGESSIPSGELENSEEESKARLEAVIMALPFFFDQASDADDNEKESEIAGEICLWARDHFQRYGHWGLQPLHWLKRVCHRRVRSFGRLQVEERSFSWEADHELAPEEGETVLDLHIPATGPLLPEDVEESLKLAREVYLSRGVRYFTCYSWLLATNLEKVLPESSNIRSFAERFTVIKKTDDETQMLERVFGMNMVVDEPDQLPQETSLQKSIAKAREDGMTFGIALGLLSF